MSWPEVHPIAKALYAALRDQTFYAALEKSVAPPVNPRSAMLAYLAYSMDEAQRYGHLCTLDGLGASIWSCPLPEDLSKKKLSQKRAFIGELLGGSSLELYNALCASMAELSGSVIDDTDWYLSILGISPEHQGRGLGPGLIRPVLEQADAAGVASYLETFSDRNRAFYNRLGYEIVGTFDEPITDATYAVMRRMPSV